MNAEARTLSIMSHQIRPGDVVFHPDGSGASRVINVHVGNWFTICRLENGDDLQISVNLGVHVIRGTLENVDPTLMDVARNEAWNIVQTIATELEELAARLRKLSSSFHRENDGKNVDRAGEMLNQFSQGTGVIGGRFASVVHAAAIADRAFNQKA